MMTQRYSHHYPESLRDAVEVLDKLVTNQSQLGSPDLTQPLQVVVSKEIGRRSSVVEQVIRNH